MNYSTNIDLSNNAIVKFISTYSSVSVIIGILSIVAMWKLFVKAGKPGWASIIPIYNVVVMFQIVGINPWLILLMLVPIANIVVAIMLCSKLAKSFGKGNGFAVGLFFLNTIFILILGLGDSKYVGPVN